MVSEALHLQTDIRSVHRDGGLQGNQYDHLILKLCQEIVFSSVSLVDFKRTCFQQRKNLGFVESNSR